MPSDITERFKGRFVHCLACDSVAIRCEHCGDLSCTGGGCERCHEDFLAVLDATQAKLPSKIGLPKTGGGMDIILRSVSPEAKAEQERDGISLHEWIRREHQKLIDAVISREQEQLHNR